MSQSGATYHEPAHLDSATQTPSCPESVFCKLFQNGCNPQWHVCCVAVYYYVSLSTQVCTDLCLCALFLNKVLIKKFIDNYCI